MRRRRTEREFSSSAPGGAGGKQGYVRALNFFRGDYRDGIIRRYVYGRGFRRNETSGAASGLAIGLLPCCSVQRLAQQGPVGKERRVSPIGGHCFREWT